MVDGGAVLRIVRVPVDTGVGAKDGAKLGLALGICDGGGDGGAPTTNDDAPNSTQELLSLNDSSAMTRIILFQPPFIEGLHVPEAVRTVVKPSASMLYDGSL